MRDVKNIVELACRELFGREVSVVMTRPDEQFGDYSTNVALQLSKELSSNPRDLANQLADIIRRDDAGFLSNVEVAGPGFINLTLSDTKLLSELENKPGKSLAKQKVLVEYSDPNPLKPLHAGHLYTTLVGDSIARLVENAGAKTIRLNYGGDVGPHIAKSLWSIIRELGGEEPELLNKIPEADRPQWLGERYVEGNTAYESSETDKQEIIGLNKKVYQLHAKNDHESEFAQIYWTVRQWSYDYFKVLYDQLRVEPFDRFIPESEATPLGLRTVEQQTGSVYQLSDGAVIFDGDKFGLHTRVFINSEGLPTYETKEVGLIEIKWNDYNFDKSIVITANEQEQYMKVVLKSIEQYNPEPVGRTTHLSHGIVKLTGGVKMSSRRGNVLGALDILESARTAGLESGKATDESTILAAVKYAFLRVRIGADIIYDPKEAISLEGNSGPYLQYAHARAMSILQKSDKSENLQASELLSGERSLARKLSQYNEIVELATKDLSPHHICTYLYELAQCFNRFYEKNRVIGDEREQIRLGLINKYTQTLKAGLGLLGIDAPDKM